MLRKIYPLILVLIIAISNAAAAQPENSLLPEKEKSKETTPYNRTQGTLDVVMCIDRSGSMMDDIKAVQLSADNILAQLGDFANSGNITLQVGLLIYTRHDEPDWLIPTALTTDVRTIRNAIAQINITDAGVGKGGNEDIYGALMFAMNRTVGGRQIDMGWRTGAAKIIFPIGDEPPDDPDWENRTLADIAYAAKELDPVHMYPLLMPKQGSSFLDPTVASMERIANATGGQVIRVGSADELPEAIVSTVKLAVRLHRDEVWRQENPPYIMYGAAGAMILMIILISITLMFRGVATQKHTGKP